MSATITCCIRREDVDASAPGWTQCDLGWVCGGCNDAASEPWPEDDGRRGPDAAGGADMTPWQKMGTHKGKN